MKTTEDQLKKIAVVQKQGYVNRDVKYQKYLFNRPLRSGFLTRVIFFSYNKQLYRLFPSLQKGNDFSTLLCVFSFVFLLGGLLIFSIIFHPNDYYQLVTAPRYSRPSQIYALDQNNHYTLVTEFYSQARRPIRLQENLGRDSEKEKKQILTENSTKKIASLKPQIINVGSTQTLSQKNYVKAEPILTMQDKIVRTFIIVEDARFLYHPGIDPLGIFRAFWVNIFAGRIKEGASTITQQVARLRFLSRERSVLRKLREAILSFLLEWQYSKQEIMEDYLNMVPLGHGTNGIEAASQFYFQKSCKELNWGEAALLVSLTTRPRSFSPILNPRHSVQKVRSTLQRLVESGEITTDQAEKSYFLLRKDFYATLNRSPNDSAFRQRLNAHPYVTTFVRSQLPKEYRSHDVLSNDGLRIYTSIRQNHQRAAEKETIPYLKELTEQRRKPPFRNYKIFDIDFSDIYHFTSLLFQVAKAKNSMSREKRDLTIAFHNKLATDIGFLSQLVGETNISRAIDYHLLYGKRFASKQKVEGGLVSLLPFSGEITAVIGGSGFKPDNQQLRFQSVRRQPGSAFKPIIIASAIEASQNKEVKNKVTAATIFDDTPLHFINRDLSEYSPENYSNSYEGQIRLRKALTLSKNSVSIQVYRKVGPKFINPIAEKILQMDRKSPPVLLPQEATVALGSYGLSPMDMAKAYAVFPSGGKEVFPHVIKRIVDRNGNTIYNYEDIRKKQKPRQIISASTAKIMISMLKDVVEFGTGTGARIPGREVAGKTGTTNRSTDAWFVGFTPSLVTAIYIGYDKPASLGANSTGGGLVAPVWGRYMYNAIKKTSPKSYDFPYKNLHKITICESTGFLPDPNCNEQIEEFFLQGTEPVTVKPLWETKHSQENRRGFTVEDDQKIKNKQGTNEVLRDDDFSF